MLDSHETERQRTDVNAIAFAARRYAKDTTVQAVARGVFHPSRTDGVLFLRQPEGAMACTLLTERNGIVAGWSFFYHATHVSVDVVWQPLLRALPSSADGVGSLETIASMTVPKVTGLVSLCHTLGLRSLPHVQGTVSMPYNDRGHSGDKLAAHWHAIVDTAFFVFSKLQ